MEMKSALLVGLDVGAQVGQATEDTVTPVVVNGQQLTGSLSIILLHPEEGGNDHDGVKCRGMIARLWNDVQTGPA